MFEIAGNTEIILAGVATPDSAVISIIRVLFSHRYWRGTSLQVCVIAHTSGQTLDQNTRSHANHCAIQPEHIGMRKIIACINFKAKTSITNAKQVEETDNHP